MYIGNIITYQYNLFLHLKNSTIKSISSNKIMHLATYSMLWKTLHFCKWTSQIQSAGNLFIDTILILCTTQNIFLYWVYYWYTQSNVSYIIISLRLLHLSYGIYSRVFLSYSIVGVKNVQIRQKVDLPGIIEAIKNILSH